MKTVKNIFAWLSCVTVLIFLTGCASPAGKSSEFVIQLSESGKITIEDKDVSLSRLCEHLKDIGLTPKTYISVEIPQNITQNTLRTISSTLASGGFRKIVFKKPRTSSAEISK